MLTVFPPPLFLSFLFSSRFPRYLPHHNHFLISNRLSSMSPLIRRGLRLASPILRPSLRILEKISTDISSNDPEAQRDYWVMTQFCRYFQSRLTYPLDGEFWLRVFAPWGQNMIKFQIRLCEIVQRESFLLETNGMLGGEQEKCPEQNDELQSRNREYWKTERLIQRLGSLLPEGPLKRAYDSLQEHPEWGLLSLVVVKSRNMVVL